ncbi:hypothetical protein CU098_001238, partial [Rhizopus stolonifer]
LPIILVIVTKSFSSADFQREFTISRNGLLLEASCKFWAKKCVLLTANAVSNHLNQVTLDPIIALGLFLTCHELYQIPEHHRSYTALMLLSSTAKEILSRETYQKIKKSSTFHQLNDTKRIFAQIVEENDNRIDSINKKTRSCAEKGILAIEQIQKNLEGDNTREENSVTTKIYTTKDALFIESLSKPGKNKNWRLTFDKGKAEEESIEIKSYQLKKFPPLPLELKEYLQTLLEYTSLDLDTLYCKLSTVRLHPVNDSAKEWAQSTILNTIKLFMCNYIPLTDQSEGDIIRIIWILLDTVFDHSTIISRGGEKSSSASSDGRNQSRTIASVDPMARKLCGRKIDLLFKSASAELGCMECGRSDGVNTTKEMEDGSIKLPKILKDMFIGLCNFAPSFVNDLAVPGVITMNSKFTLVTMDSPCGYVCRLSRVKSIYFPSQPFEIITYLVPILKQVYSIRLLMEQNLKLMSAVPVDIDEDISFEVKNKV